MGNTGVGIIRDVKSEVAGVKRLRVAVRDRDCSQQSAGRTMSCGQVVGVFFKAHEIRATDG